MQYNVFRLLRLEIKQKNLFVILIGINLVCASHVKTCTQLKSYLFQL